MPFRSKWALHQFKKKKKKDKSCVWAFPGSWQWQFLENEHLRSFKLVLAPPVAAHFHRYCACEAVMVLGLPWGWGDEQIKKLQTSLLSARFRPFSIKLTFLRLLPDIDFQNLEKVIFFLALLWLLWRSWFPEVLTLPFRQCFCCIFRKCFLGPGWIENLNTKTADLRLAPAEIWWVAPFVSIGLAQPSKICFHPFLPPNPLSFICPSVPLSLSPPFPPYFLSTSIYWPSL